MKCVESVQKNSIKDREIGGEKIHITNFSFFGCMGKYLCARSSILAILCG